ncbi:MAG TPA: nucleoside-diphosphate kinase [Patescibacteria group bacterium]|nr:nucleoside-diphosphate kinase [Patescibacteria group bacterium]
MEESVVLIKPDGVKRGLVGEIIRRFERAGLKLIAMKMIWVDKDVVGKHYTDKKAYLIGIGKKTLESYKKYGKDPREELGTKNPLEIGKMVREWNMEFLSSGPVIALLWQGPSAVEIIRKIVGSTFPASAPPGTIRGDYSFDSAMFADTRKRSTKNLIHASGDAQEAKFERQLWFREEEIYDYKRSEEEVMF